jgi:ABC-2 type transport system permease protein
MSTQPNVLNEYAGIAENAVAEIPWTSRFYWSVRRELWEFRSIYLVQFAVAGIFLFGFLVSLLRLPHKMRHFSVLDPMQQRKLIAQPFEFAAGLIMAAGFLVGIFYALEALQSERRDRSILFWKSLPVSDGITVLAKASIPMAVIPALSFVLAVVVQLIMLLLSLAVMPASGVSLDTFFGSLPIFQMWLVLAYHLLVLHSLGFAPLYGWLLLVSGWARRLAFLWAVLPLIAVGIMANVVFDSPNLFGFFGDTPGGDGFTHGMMMEPLARIHPSEFFGSPIMWVGLSIAALLLACAVRLRRYREPM